MTRTLTHLQAADDWVVCEQGHEHWGLAGAAGLMLRTIAPDGLVRYLMQHRSPTVHHGGTWSTLGGALNFHEDAEQGALREAQEEFGPLPNFTVVSIHEDAHGGWSYFTVHADVEYFHPQASRDEDGESLEHRWCTAQEIDALDLHPGFAAMWSANRSRY